MFPDWDWTSLTLPARHFSWRVRGNPLYWSIANREELSRHYDLVIVTSMVDLATLRGLVPSLTVTPTVVYFHENQFDYPSQQGQTESLEAQMVSIYSALAADQLVFNSSYNRDTFFIGLERLLNKLPDFVPGNVVDLLKPRACVVPVPVALERTSSGVSIWPARGQDNRVRILWLGRFEYDKAPERLLNLLEALECHALSYHLAIVGQQFRQLPEAFARIRSAYAENLICMGFVEERSAYCRLLREADMVVSTALHEFQGIAVGEAVASGCTPVVPDRLAYSEYYCAPFRYQSWVDDPRKESEAMAQRVVQLAQQQSRATSPAAVQDWSETALLPRYMQAFRDAGCALPG